MNDLIEDDAGGFALQGARDPASGECYFPWRPLVADGSLRKCAPMALSREGLLYTWTRFAGRDYGQVDLREGVRIQCELGEGPHEIGGPYHLAVTVVDGVADWRFDRG